MHLLPSPSVSSSILLQAGVDIDVRDYDGWTPLHAAAHWGQEEACRILVENYCAMDIKNVAVSGKTVVFKTLQWNSSFL